MTTDTFPRSRPQSADRRRRGDLAGMAKGAGMIAPDMATMLSFVFTDAPIAAEVLQKLLDKGVEPSFNASPSTATLRPPTRCCCSPPAPPPDAACQNRFGARRAAQGLPPRPRRGAASTSPSRSCATAKGRANSSSVAVEGAVPKNRLKANRQFDRQFAAGEDGDRRRGRQLGPHRHGCRQGGRAGRARPPCLSGSAISASPTRGCATPAMTKKRFPRSMRPARDRDPRRSRPRHRQGDDLHLRPDQGICRHQRRLPVVTRRHLLTRHCEEHRASSFDARHKRRAMATTLSKLMSGLLRSARNDTNVTPRRSRRRRCRNRRYSAARSRRSA